MKRLLLLLTTLSAFIICGCSDNRSELNVYTWSDYIDDGLVKEFEDNKDKIIAKIQEETEWTKA